MACSHLYVFVHLYAHLANLGNAIKSVQATICTLGTSTTSKVVNAWPATKAPLMANTANTGGSFCLWAACILFDLGWFPLLSHVGHIPLSHLLREFADIVLKFWCSDVLCIIGQEGSWQPYSTQPIATSQLDFLQRLEILNSNLPVSFPTLQILSQMDTNGYIMLDSSIHPKAPYSESLLLPVELSRLEGFEIVSAFRLVPAQWCQ